jgi:transcription antitermination factor NusG
MVTDQFCLTKKKRSEDIWIVMKVKSHSQHKIIKNYQMIKYIIGDVANSFYVPEIEGKKDKKVITEAVIPFVMFVNVTTLAFDLWGWKNLDSNIYNFYYHRKTGKVYIVSQKEIDDLAESVKTCEIEFDHSIKVGDRVTVQKGAFIGHTGIIKRIKSDLCYIKMPVGSFATDIWLKKDLLVREV